MANPNNADEQERYFKDATEAVRRHAFYMQEEIDKDRLHDAIKHAYAMIGELRTSKLLPTRYYELYMAVTSELTHLETHIMDKFREKHKTGEANALEWLTELYNRVQFCGNIVPRLYLLVTVTSVKLKIYKDHHEDVMKTIFDVVELSKGVQHPTRGLFLRNYLSQVCRSVLPDVPDGVLVGSLDDHPFVKQSVDLALKNFAEMTRLWVRMQHQGAVRDRGRREKERLQLRMLVGTNLRRLSELNCISKAVYQEYVLKNLLENIVKSKDRIAQEYLMECIIMVFGDEYHLATLESFLSAVNKLHSSVAVDQIVIKLMNRLAKYAEQNADHRQSFKDKNVFETFEKQVKEIIHKHKKMTIDDTLGLYVELVNFAAQCYPGKDEYVVSMIKESLETIHNNNNEIPSSSIPHVSRMLLAPLKSMQLRVLDVKEYRELITYLNHEERRRVSNDIVAALVQLDNVYLRTSEQVETLFGMIEPLLYDATSGEDKTKGTQKGKTETNEQNKEKNENETKKKKEKTANGDEEDSSCQTDDEQHAGEKPEENKNEADTEAFEMEQSLMAKLIQLIYNEDTDVQFETLHVARKHFGKGGDRRLLYTFPALVFNGLSLIHRTHQKLTKGNEDGSESVPTMKPKKMFQFVHKICHVYGSHAPELGCRMWLQGALEASNCSLPEICYEFFSQGFLCYEEYISDSNEQYEALRCIIGALQNTKKMEEENFDTLRSKCVQHSQRLLKKPHCARAFCLCAHLYWDTEFKQADTAGKCLKKAGQKANSMMEGVEKLEIFVEILNKYIYLLMKQCPNIELEKVSQLIGVIKEIDSADDDAEKLEEVKQYFRASCQYITDLAQGGGPDIAPQFSQITI